MSLGRGDTVRFKGDPEKATYQVNYVNDDGETVDLYHNDGEWEYVPVRLLELARDPVSVGDVYRGRSTGNLYYVVGKETDGVFLFVEGSEPRGVERDLYPSQFLSENYTRVRDGRDLS